MDKIRANGTRLVDDLGRERIFSGVNVVDKSAYSDGAQQQMRNKQQELMQPIQEKAIKAIGEVAGEKGLLYVIDDAVAIYISPDAVDVMADVKKKLGIN